MCTTLHRKDDAILYTTYQSCYIFDCDQQIVQYHCHVPSTIP